MKLTLPLTLASVVVGAVVGLFLVPASGVALPQQISSSNLTVSRDGSAGPGNQSSSSAAEVLGSPIIGPKKGALDQGLQAGPKSVDELIGNADITIKNNK